jgi:hypothetical protein
VELFRLEPVLPIFKIAPLPDFVIRSQVPDLRFKFALTTLVLALFPYINRRKHAATRGCMPALDDGTSYCMDVNRAILQIYSTTFGLLPPQKLSSQASASSSSGFGR